jgi:hypothetical protein
MFIFLRYLEVHIFSLISDKMANKILFVFGLIVMGAIFDEGECQRRHRLCVNSAGTCSDTQWRRGRIAPATVGRCDKKRGTCEFVTTGRGNRCMCAIMFDV